MVFTAGVLARCPALVLPSELGSPPHFGAPNIVGSPQLFGALTTSGSPFRYEADAIGGSPQAFGTPNGHWLACRVWFSLELWLARLPRSSRSSRLALLLWPSCSIWLACHSWSPLTAWLAPLWWCPCFPWLARASLALSSCPARSLRMVPPDDMARSSCMVRTCYDGSRYSSGPHGRTGSLNCVGTLDLSGSPTYHGASP